MTKTIFALLVMGCCFLACNEDELQTFHSSSHLIDQFTIYHTVTDYGYSSHEGMAQVSDKGFISSVDEEARLEMDHFQSGTRVKNIDHKFIAEKPTIEERKSENFAVLAVVLNNEDTDVIAMVHKNIFSQEQNTISLHNYLGSQHIGGANISGEVVHISIEDTHNDLFGIGNAALPLLKAKNYHVDNYDYVVFLTDNINAYQGQALINGKYAHVDDISSSYVLIHEFCHLLGLRHASTMNSEYGDCSSVMGCQLVEMNAPNKHHLSWFNKKDTYVYKNRPAQVNIHALEKERGAKGSNKKLIVIPGANNEELIISIRDNGTMYNQDLDLIFTKEVSIHKAIKFKNRSFLLETLASGSAYMNEEFGVNIKNIGGDGNFTTISITPLK